MLKTFSLVSLLGIAIVMAGDSDVLYTRALELFEKRHLDKENALKAKELAGQITEKEPGNVNALILLSRAYFFSGENLEKDDDRRAAYEKGTEYAKKALGLDIKNANAHFYYGAGLGRCAQLKGIFNAIGSAAVPKKQLSC